MQMWRLVEEEFGQDPGSAGEDTEWTGHMGRDTGVWRESVPLPFLCLGPGLVCAEHEVQTQKHKHTHIHRQRVTRSRRRELRGGEQTGFVQEPAHVGILSHASLAQLLLGEDAHPCQRITARGGQGHGVHGQADGHQPIRDGDGAARGGGLATGVCLSA